MINFPLEVRFNLLAVPSPLSVTDRGQHLHFHVKPNLFKRQEPIEVFSDNSESELLYRVSKERGPGSLASPRFVITDKNDTEIGRIHRRAGASVYSIWYDLFESQQLVGTIKEASAGLNAVKSCLGSIPLLGFIVAFLFGPVYLLAGPGGTVKFKVRKRRTLFRGRFIIETDSVHDPDAQVRAVLYIITMLLTEYCGSPV
jgi:hypothetical protein